jgi:hypothetical protein
MIKLEGYGLVDTYGERAFRRRQRGKIITYNKWYSTSHEPVTSTYNSLLYIIEGIWALKRSPSDLWALQNSIPTDKRDIAETTIPGKDEEAPRYSRKFEFNSRHWPPLSIAT